MQLYGYAPLTGIYTGPVTAEPCPLGSGDWIVPAFCTDVPPPVVGPKQAAVFKDGAWSVVADHRGETWWSGLQSVLIQAVGDPAAAGLSPTPPPDTVTGDGLPAPDMTLLEYAALARWRKETGGILFNGLPILTDDRSKQMIMGARMAAEADPLFRTMWAGADGNVYPLIAAQIIAISNAVAAHVNRCFEIYASVKAAIEATPPTITAKQQIDQAFA